MEVKNRPNIQNQTERPGYKKTKLGWIPEEWSTPTIPEIFKFLKTTSFSRSKMNYDEKEGVYCIHYGDIHATYQRPILDFNEDAEIPKINDEVKLPSTMEFLKDGDLIIADASEDYGGIGSAIEITNLNGKQALSGLHTFAFRDTEEKTVQGFRFYIFKNPQVKKALKTIATGSKVYGVSKGNLEKFRIVLPTLPEQKKIAKILSTWDTAILTQEQLIAAKETFKKGLMQVLLTGKKRFEGFEGEWEKLKIKDFTKVMTGSTPPTKNRENYGNQFLFVSPVDLGGIKYIDNTEKGLSNIGFEKSRKFPIGSVLFTCIGSTIGKSGIASEDLTSNQQINAILPGKNHDNDFVYYQLSYLAEKIKLLASSQAVPMINKTEFESIYLILPTKKEQQKIASVLSGADKEIEHLKQQLVQLQDQKRGLVQRLLTGAVRVKID